MSCDNSKSKRLTGSLRGNGRAHGKNGATINDVAKRVGFYGTEVGEHMTPCLSSVRQPIYDMPAQGIKMLVTMI